MPVRVVGAEHRTETVLVATEDGAVDVTVRLETFATRAETFGGGGLGVPLHVLVDETGRIIASSPELPNRELSGLIERALR